MVQDTQAVVNLAESEASDDTLMANRTCLKNGETALTGKEDTKVGMANSLMWCQ